MLIMRKGSNRKEFVQIEITLDGKKWYKFVQLSKLRGVRFEVLIAELISEFTSKYTWEDIKKMQDEMGCRCGNCSRNDCDKCVVCNNCPNKGYINCVRY